MTNYRRSKFPGGYYFFTLVTYKRKPFLTDVLARNCLKQAWQKIHSKRPFDLIALCLLPDHLHCIWRLPDGDDDYTTRWSLIKKGFTYSYLKNGGSESSQTKSRSNKRERGIWQRRFWEHHIRDADDLQRHLDYIHYNPVKHKIVEKLDEWPYSTYQRYLTLGRYAQESYKDIQHDLNNIFTGE